MTQHNDTHERWPALPFAEWKDTAATLHMWTQIVGKIRMEQMPWLNHSWHVTLYVSSRGLTTSPIPHGNRTFEIEFDFIDHRLLIETCDGDRCVLPLEPQTTADFYSAVTTSLRELDMPIRINARPNEVEPAIPFAEDREHASYDPEASHRFWKALVQVDRLFGEFRARFTGKASPSHFFWGSFDLAVTRFSGRTAPPHPGGFPNMPDVVTREAYSHEVSSVGFWSGGETMPQAIFYSYAYPTPDGFADATVLPEAASWNADLGEFVLPYDAVRTAADPDATLLDFMQSTYEAAAKTGKWDRDALERAFERRPEPGTESPTAAEVAPIGSDRAHDPRLALLVEAYMKGLRTTLADLERAERESKREDLSALVHRLRGTAGLYGLSEIGEAAGACEDALRDGADWNEVLPLVREVQDLVRRRLN